MTDDNIYQKLKDILIEMGGDFSILEEQVDVNLQVEFFELVNQLSENKRENKLIIEEKDKLFDTETGIEEKKKWLIKRMMIFIPGRCLLSNIVELVWKPACLMKIRFSFLQA